MGAASSIALPDVISKSQCQEIVGQSFSEELWLQYSKDDTISKEELIKLATIKSVVVLAALESSNVTGVVTFEQTFISNPTKITYQLSGLSPGPHGLHIKDSHDHVNPDKHFNPHGKNHGGPNDEERHAGDLGNIEANAAGEAQGEIISNLIVLSGDFSILGHSVVVCSGPDDYGKGGHEDSLINGHSGLPVASGDIHRTESMEPKQGSAMRSKFMTQASSRIERAKAEYMKPSHDDDDDPFGQPHAEDEADLFGNE